MPVVREKKKRKKSLGRRLRRAYADMIKQRDSGLSIAFIAIACILALIAARLFLRYISE